MTETRHIAAAFCSTVLPALLFFSLLPALSLLSWGAQRTEKPVLHGKHWVAITGKPLAATAGATIFHKGGNAVDAACAMLAAVSTMHDALGWGGETQALIYNPSTKKVVGVNALGVAPTGATPEFFRSKGLAYPPDVGPLAAVTPGFAGRAAGDAGRIRHDVAQGRPGSGARIGRRLSDRGGTRAKHRKE